MWVHVCFCTFMHVCVCKEPFQSYFWLLRCKHSLLHVLPSSDTIPLYEKLSGWLQKIAQVTSTQQIPGVAVQNSSLQLSLLSSQAARFHNFHGRVCQSCFKGPKWFMNYNTFLRNNLSQPEGQGGVMVGILESAYLHRKWVSLLTLQIPIWYPQHAADNRQKLLWSEVKDCFISSIIRKSFFAPNNVDLPHIWRYYHWDRILCILARTKPLVQD